MDLAFDTVSVVGILMRMSDYDVLEYGAVADGVANDAAALQRAVDACAAAGGGRVVIPFGRRVRAGYFCLRSGVELHIAEQGCLISATKLEDFHQHVFAFGPEAEKRIWIGAKDATDVKLSGAGTIDGQCHAFALEEASYGYTKTLSWRPAMTCFENIKRMEVSGLTFRNAANWTLHFSGCHDVHVHDIRIFNDLRFPNADGIDPDHCQRVRIERCHIVSADDCIVLKNTEPFARYGACEDIEISDCRLESVSSAIKIGSESHNLFRRIRVSRCVIERSNRGITMQLRDRGSIEDVIFEDIEVETQRFHPMWWGAGEAIALSAHRRNPQTVCGSIRAVQFRNIRCKGEGGIVLYANPVGAIRDVRFTGVSVEIQRHSEWPAAIFDVRPQAEGVKIAGCRALGDDTPWGRVFARAPAAVSLDGCTDIQFDSVSVRLPPASTEQWMPLRSQQSKHSGTIEFIQPD